MVKKKDNSLIEYIKENLKRGYSHREIENVLINHGYPLREVYEAMEYIKSIVTKKSRKNTVIFTTIISIVLVGLLVFLFVTFYPKVISEQEFSLGTNFKLKETQNKAFVFEGEEHTISVESISSNSVGLIIQSDPIRISLNVGAEEKIDLNDDGIYDLLIRLNNIGDRVPEIYIKKISEIVCVEIWECTDWYECSYSYNDQVLGCELSPLESPSPPGFSPSECWDGTQVRLCTDSNNCGTTINMPELVRECSTPSPPVSPPIPPEETPETLSCDNWNCLVEASKGCELSDFTNTMSLDFFGVNSTTTTYYKIGAYQEGVCNFKLRTEEQHVKYTDELIQQLLDFGLTQEQIDQQEQESNELSDLLEGREGVCKFNSQDLTDLLTRWAAGDFDGGASCSIVSGGEGECTFTSGDFETSQNCEWECTYTGDFEVALSCEGEYFDPNL